MTSDDLYLGELVERFQRELDPENRRKLWATICAVAETPPRAQPYSPPERNIYKDWLEDLLTSTREFDRDEHIDAADFLEWFSEWRQETLSSELLYLDYQPETPEDDDDV